MLPLNLSDGTFSIIAAFLNEIGIPVEIGEIHQPTFLPGIYAGVRNSSCGPGQALLARRSAARSRAPGPPHRAGAPKTGSRQRGRRRRRTNSAPSPGPMRRLFICGSTPPWSSTNTATAAAARASSRILPPAATSAFPCSSGAACALDEKSASRLGRQAVPAHAALGPRLNSLRRALTPGSN